MNRYPLWKYALMVVAIALGALYTIPNFFPYVPAVQVSSTKATIRADEALKTRVENILKAEKISYLSAFVDQVGVKVRFQDADIQARAKDALSSSLNSDDYTVALNQISDVPGWMEKINAKPMYLGLDLRGGVHFLLEVDMNGAMTKAADRYATDLRTLLRSKKIQSRGVVRETQTVAIRFTDSDLRERARAEIERNHPELLLQETGTGSENLRLIASLKPDEQKKIQDSAIIQNVTTLRNRVNELGVSEPIVQQSGANRIVVQLPGVQDTARAKEILGRTASLEIRLVNEDQSALEAAKRGQIPYGSDLYNDRNGKPILIYRDVVLTGDRINDAQPGFDSRTNQPAVHVKLDSVGARIFKDVTRENVNKRMAILLVEKNRSEVITAPNINEEIGGGNVQISGSMTTREANDIALLMRAGSLAAPMEIVEERTVGPSLGQDNITRGKHSVLGGFIALMLFICAYYRVMGLVSAMSLCANLMLLIGLLSALQATLTLPGIAAVALTLGIAIDANVLINERIREELRWGASPHTAIAAGYERAWSTILDSNITNLIAGLALLVFGTGPVRGFAVVHCLGIMTSVFSAVFISRGLVSLIYGRKKQLEKISVGQVWKPPVETLAANFATPDGAKKID